MLAWKFFLRMLIASDTILVLQLKDLTVTQLKYYLTANNLPLAGKKEALISRILTHMGKWPRPTIYLLCKIESCVATVPMNGMLWSPGVYVLTAVHEDHQRFWKVKAQFCVDDSRLIESCSESRTNSLMHYKWAVSHHENMMQISLHHCMYENFHFSSNLKSQVDLHIFCASQRSFLHLCLISSLIIVKATNQEIRCLSARCIWVLFLRTRVNSDPENYEK